MKTKVIKRYNKKIRVKEVSLLTRYQKKRRLQKQTKTIVPLRTQLFSKPFTKRKMKIPLRPYIRQQMRHQVKSFGNYMTNPSLYVHVEYYFRSSSIYLYNLTKELEEGEELEELCRPRISKGRTS